MSLDEAECAIREALAVPVPHTVGTLGTGTILRTDFRALCEDCDPPLVGFAVPEPYHDGCVGWCGCECNRPLAKSEVVALRKLLRDPA